MKLRKMISRIIYREKSSSEAYVKWLKKHGCDIGEGVHFYSPKTTTVDSVRLDWIHIGSYTKITEGVTILAHDYSPSVLIHTHHHVLLAGGGYTHIGDNCFLGMHCIILSGRHIGNNCIIGAGAVVTKDIPDNSVVVGNPARVVNTLDELAEKRSSLYLQDAKRNVIHFNQVHHRKPKIEELHGFAFLFLERTEENWRKYFTGYLVHDNDESDVRASFFESEPVFNSYESFIDFCLESK